LVQILTPVHVVSISIMLMLIIAEGVVAVRFSSQKAQGVIPDTTGWRRIHLMGYHTAMVAAIFTGAVLAVTNNSFQSGGWLHLKIGLLVLLIGIGAVVGKQFKNLTLSKGVLTGISLLGILLSGGIVYLAVYRPF